MIELIDTVNMPAYAIPYLMNSDSSGLSSAEIEEIECNITEFYEEYLPLSFKYGEADEFNINPAFGLPCETIKTEIWGTSP